MEWRNYCQGSEQSAAEKLRVLQAKGCCEKGDWQVCWETKMLERKQTCANSWLGRARKCALTS